MENDATEPASAPVYRVTMWRKGERFYVHLPELSILVSDPDLQAAYDKLEAARKAALKEYLDAGAPDLIPRPQIGKVRAVMGRLASSGASGLPAQPGFWRQIASFVAKTAVAGAVTVFVLVYAMNYAIESFDRVLAADLSGRAYGIVHRAAERLRNANPEARETLRQDLRTIARELKPLIEEVAQPSEAPPPEKP